MSYTYQDVIERSVQVCWRIDDLLPEGTTLDFSRPHLPEALVGGDELDFLTDAERLSHNHIRGNAYMNLFAFVEEYIIAQTVKHAQAEMFGDHEAIRALLRFGEEEVKHQRLFQRYRSMFERQFGCRCDVLEAAAAVASVILSKKPLAVMLVTLHLELMTQRHYTDAVKEERRLDPLFSNILKHHWLEESQHARIDVLEIQKMVRFADEAVIAAAIDDYFDLLDAFDGLLCDQVDMDLTTLERKIGRQLSEAERARLKRSQRTSYRNDFLVMGMTNKLFQRTLAALAPDALERLSAAVDRLVPAP